MKTIAKNSTSGVSTRSTRTGKRPQDAKVAPADVAGPPQSTDPQSPAADETPLSPPPPSPEGLQGMLSGEPDAKPSAPPDFWDELEQRMSAVVPDQIAAIESTVTSAKRHVADAFRRGYGLPDRDRSALRCMLAQAISETATRFELLIEAMAYRERLRTARHVNTIRAARLELRSVIAQARERGCAADVLEQCERLVR